MTTWNDFLKSLAVELNRPTRAQRKCASVRLNDGRWISFFGTNAIKDASDCRQRQTEQRERIRAAMEADAIDRCRR